MSAAERSRHRCTVPPARALVRWAGLAGLALLAAWSTRASAQAITYSGSAVDLGQVTVGASPSSATLPFTVPTGQVTTITGVAALTDGASGQDFAVTSTTCSGTLTGPATCNVVISFGPRRAGLRRGAVLVSAGSASATAFVHGVGVGSQLAFSPDAATATATVSPLSPVYYSPSGVVYDGAGNLYFNDFLNSRVLEQTPSGTLSVVANLPQTMSSSLAINGAGTLYVTVPSQGAVYAIPPGGPAVALSFGSVTLISPSGVAVDGSGNLYVADSVAKTIIKSAPNGSGATVLPLTGLAVPLSSPQGLAVDAGNNLYIADSGNNRIVKVVLTTGAAGQLPISGLLLYNPYGVAADAAGTVYIADTGNRRIVRVSAAGVASQIQLLNYAFLAPTGIVLSASGDLIVADNMNGVTRITRSFPTATLTFPTTTALNTQDLADGTKSITLENIGNSALQFTVPVGSAVNPTVTNATFSVAGNTTCPQLTSTSTLTSGQLGVGALCVYGVTFAPTVVGTNSGSLVIQSSPTGAAIATTSTVPLTGTGATPLNTFVVTVTPQITNAGLLNSITVTVMNSGAVAKLYRGTVTLTSSDTTATFPGAATYTFTQADAGVHTFSAPSGVIFNTAGTFTVTATDGAMTGTSAAETVGARIAPNVTVSSSASPVFLYESTTLSALVSTTAGSPTGTVTFFDGQAPLGTTALVAGRASLLASFITTGSHNITAVYSGDTTFATSTSTGFTEVVQDFTLTVTGASAQQVFPGNQVTFNFMVSPLDGGTFPAPVSLSVTGLPAGATATFAPASIAGGSPATAVALTVNEPTTLVELQHGPADGWWSKGAAVMSALLLPFALARRRRKLASLVLVMVLTLGMFGLSGCLSDQASGYFGQPVKTFTLTVTASAGALSHSTTVTLTVE